MLRDLHFKIMTEAIPKSRPSRRIDYFRERDVCFRGNHSDSHSSDMPEEYSIADLMKDMSKLTINHRFSNSNCITAKTLRSSVQTKVTLSQKHMRLYRSQWQKIWIEEVPDFADHKISANVSDIIRAKLFNWFMEIFMVYKLNKHAYFRTIMLFDNFVQTCDKPLQESEVDLWGLAALFIAVKYEEEENKLSLLDLREFSRDKYTKEVFAAAEETIFTKLGHAIGFPTFLEILDELMLRNDFVFESSSKLKTVAESIMIRCLLYPHMLKTRPDLFCGAALIYTIRLFYQHYRSFLLAAKKPFNKYELKYKEEFFVDSIAKITKLNKSMLLSVCEEIQELVEDFDDYKEKGGLYNIARLVDLDSL